MDTVYAYLAGLIDGEGCISIRKTFQNGKDQFKPMVEVGMTDIEPMKLLQNAGKNFYFLPISDFKKSTLGIGAGSRP